MQSKLAQGVLASAAVDAMLLTSPANMCYAAGFTGEGYVYISGQQRIVVTDARYTIAAREECREFEVIEWNGKPYYEALKKALSDDGVKRQDVVKRRLGVEEDNITLGTWEKIQKALGQDVADKTERVFLSQQLAELRYVKTPYEIDCIEKAEAIGDRAFAKLLPLLRIGMTEKQVAARLEYIMKEEGADGLSFDTIAASGLHSAMPHAVPTDKPLEAGDFLTMDFGCIYKGYCSDMTRTVVIGHASDRQRAIYQTVLDAQQAALEGIRPGMTGMEVDALARDVIKERGYGDNFGHSLGHSVGLEIHESPCFSEKDKTVIEPGMVITVEPGIYIEGFGGVRIEDVIVVTEQGCKNITHSEKNLIEIDQ